MILKGQFTVHYIQHPTLFVNGVVTKRRKGSSYTFEVTMAHILLIDDDTELTSLLKSFKLWRFDVSEANDGEAGLHAVNDSVDLILLDVMMPKLNGMETLKNYARNGKTRCLCWPQKVKRLTAWSV